MQKPQYYVYDLIDPRDGKTFYVGKGQRNRIHQHEHEAQKGVCSEKCNKIRDIHKNGFQIVKEFIAFFWAEDEAYSFERQRISDIGIYTLTNVALGGGGIRIAKGKKLKNLRQISRQSKPWMEGETPSNKAYAIIEKLAGQFAYWIVATKCGTQKVKMVLSDGVLAKNFYEESANYMLNKGMGELFHTALNDNVNHRKLTELFKPYNIHIEHNYGS